MSRTPSKGEGAHGTGMDAAARVRIVLLTDDLLGAAMLESRLATAGIPVVTALDSETALCCALGCYPAAIVVRLAVDPANALECGRRIRIGAGLGTDVQIIVLTDATIPTDVSAGVSVDAAERVIEARSVKTAVEILLGGAEARDRRRTGFVTQIEFNRTVNDFNADYLWILLVLGHGEQHDTTRTLASLRDRYDAILTLHESNGVVFRKPLLPFTLYCAPDLLKRWGFSDREVEQIDRGLARVRAELCGDVEEDRTRPMAERRESER
jgi:hypothetical protein